MREGRVGPVGWMGALALLVVGLASCAPKHLVLPQGAGSAVADLRTPFDQAAAACRSVTTMTAEMRLSGRAGSERMRGTLIAGFQQPDALRLEGVAPFGPPAFILVAHSGSATLVLPRDNRVVTGATAADILHALAGIRLGAAGLRALVSGCVVSRPEPASAHRFPNGWLAVDVTTYGPEAADVPSAIAYLQQVNGAWQIVAGYMAGLRVEYQQFEGGLPHRILVSSAPAPRDTGRAGVAGGGSRDEPDVAVDLALNLSQVVVNGSLERAAFEVAVPANAVPMSLADLRAAGPLGARR